MIKLKIGREYNVPFEVSKFPDGTSQLWKIKQSLENETYFCIRFIWENKEEEVFHLLMLLDLIRNANPEAFIYLKIPYLPYARQDKNINPEATFALHTFAEMLNSKGVNIVESFDVHSRVARNLIDNFHSLQPINFHNHVLSKFKPDVIFYPDEGAAKRYGTGLINEIMFYGEKIRDQLTGQITGYRLLNENFFDIQNKKVLIIDDICDGGATFVTAANELMKHNPSSIGLCVSHGIYSKGLESMKAAGISEFFTTNSLLKNEGEYNVYE